MRADRLVATLLTLQARGRVTAAQLAEELEVSVATARRDLEALSAAGIPVYPQAGRGGGWQLLGGARLQLRRDDLRGTAAEPLAQADRGPARDTERQAGQLGGPGDRAPRDVAHPSSVAAAACGRRTGPRRVADSCRRSGAAAVRVERPGAPPPPPVGQRHLQRPAERRRRGGEISLGEPAAQVGPAARRVRIARAHAAALVMPLRAATSATTSRRMRVSSKSFGV